MTIGDSNVNHITEFVAIDADRKPVRVPRLVPETDEERARYSAAEAYRAERRRR